MNSEPKEVRFDIWCGQCKYSDREEIKDPCNECLACPTNIDSEKPVFFEGKK